MSSKKLSIKSVETNGILFIKDNMWRVPLVIRYSEDDFVSLSISCDEAGVMLQAPFTEEIRRNLGI